LLAAAVVGWFFARAASAMFEKVKPIDGDEKAIPASHAAAVVAAGLQLHRVPFHFLSVHQLYFKLALTGRLALVTLSSKKNSLYEPCHLDNNKSMTTQNCQNQAAQAKTSGLFRIKPEQNILLNYNAHCSRQCFFDPIPPNNTSL